MNICENQKERSTGPRDVRKTIFLEQRDYFYLSELGRVFGVNQATASGQDILKEYSRRLWLLSFFCEIIGYPDHFERGPTMVF